MLNLVEFGLLIILNVNFQLRHFRNSQLVDEILITKKKNNKYKNQLTETKSKYSIFNVCQYLILFKAMFT